MYSTLNSDLLASMIKSKRGKTGLREMAIQIGNISPATLSRIESGNLPDVETFIRLCKWLNVPTDTFVKGEKRLLTQISNKEQIVFQLRSSRELDEETVNAMITMVDIAFTKKKNAK